MTGGDGGQRRERERGKMEREKARMKEGLTLVAGVHSAATVVDRDDRIELGGLGRLDRKSTRLNSSHSGESRMPSSA